MPQDSSLQTLYAMAAHTVGAGADPPQPATKYYFAYGSNLHLRQMSRRCPGSRFIGRGRLFHYRWQINERGYANVIEAEGHCVDGLVYEIDAQDEAQLDINEGVSKNAYSKSYLTLQLHYAGTALYHRPVSWLVDNGGAAKAKVLAEQEQDQDETEDYPPQWEHDILVYISHDYTIDGSPRDEYVKRINWGLNDARALGMDREYISNCIRPYVPAPPREAPIRKKPSGTTTTTPAVPTGTKPSSSVRTTPPSRQRPARRVPGPASRAKPIREAKRGTQRSQDVPRALHAQSLPAPSRPSARPSARPFRSPPAQASNRPSRSSNPAASRQRVAVPSVVLSAVPGQARSREPARIPSPAPTLPPRPWAETVHHTVSYSLWPASTVLAQVTADEEEAPPLLPPRPVRCERNIPIIVVEENTNI